MRKKENKYDFRTLDLAIKESHMEVQITKLKTSKSENSFPIILS